MTVTMAGIALVFTVTNMTAPGITEGPKVSDTLFESREACAEFVNRIADDGTNSVVVDANGEFEFASIDGVIFRGGCYSAEDLKRKMAEQQI